MITSTLTIPKQEVAPIYVTDISRRIKALGGTIWDTGKADFGFYVRAEVDTFQLRIIIAKPGQPAPPEEKGIYTHVVTTMEALSNFLTSLTAESAQK